MARDVFNPTLKNHRRRSWIFSWGGGTSFSPEHPPAHQVHTNEHSKGMDVVDVEFNVEFDVVDVGYPVVPLMGRWAPSASNSAPSARRRLRRPFSYTCST